MIKKLFEKKKEESNRRLEIIEKYEGCTDPLVATHSFVREYLNPQPDRYDMTYRYEHSLRVALWGKRIAEGEGWESEPLIMACLLHDVGYPECKTIADFDRHPAFSAEVAELFLSKIHYDKELSNRICKAIAIHDKWNDVPADATPFELSVRDADDLDRFDIMRMCMLGRNDIGERAAAELIALCDKRMDSKDGFHERVCGTDTARELWRQQLQVRKQFYEGLKKQMQGTFEMEEWLQQ